MTRTKAWIAAIALVAVVIVLLGWFTGIQPKLAEARKADNERASVATINDAHEQTVLELRKLDDRLPELEKELAALRVALPTDPAVSTLLGQLNELALDNSVGIESITAGTPLELTPAAPAPGEVPAPADASAGAPVPDETTEAPAEAAPVAPVRTDIVSIPVTVIVSGETDALAAFLRSVQYGPRLFLVTDLVVDIEGSGGKSTIDGLIYVQLDPKAEASAE
ncbi:type 4a pilus biogenesis protein PilO [Mycetocola miduiensis]|uniref:Pilus assembly protein, PilO n=1 Tax=Mycetocola miduiensis TaxID=995034 RepID=A0A1I5D1L3_9MICO|nr:type 4a pilus biogenesis protein PilO [Mycetocola miduiensis]SFN93130.1 Pilus assembly protein, PilO [Mycetocola miduiensis]